jgi:hypothetical protein
MAQSYESLEALGEALRRQLPINAIFTSVNTRLILQTGVNLKNVKPWQNADVAAIEAVSRALTRMGIELEDRHG